MRRQRIEINRTLQHAGRNQRGPDAAGGTRAAFRRGIGLAVAGRGQSGVALQAFGRQVHGRLMRVMAAISMAMRLVLVRRRGAARAMPGQSCLPLCGFRLAGRTGAHACRCNGLQRQCGDQHPQNEFAHGIQHGEKV